MPKKNTQNIDDKIDYLTNLFKTMQKQMLGGFQRVENRFERIDDKFQKIDNKFETLEDEIHSYRKDVINYKSEVMDELKVIREEQTGHQGQHDRLSDLPERVEKLESVHPH